MEPTTDEQPALPKRRPRRPLVVAGAIAAAGVAVVLALVVVVRPGPTAPACPPIASHPEWSVARRWDEALLDAIRRALPNPPVHARNLFHVSAAMWDAWAAYDPTASGLLRQGEAQRAGRRRAARNEAISYAAYRVLTSRFIKSVGADKSLSEFDDLMDALCYPLDATTTDGRLARRRSATGSRRRSSPTGLADGSNEANGYTRPDLHAGEPAARRGRARRSRMVDPNRWQPLQIEHMISQNGIPVTNGVQQAVGPHWGHVKTFALPAGGADGVPIDPGPPPQARRSGDRPGVQGPGRRGDPRQQPARPDGRRHHRHLARRARQQLRSAPTTARAIRSTRRPASRTRRTSSTLGDFGRVMAEFWADGPKLRDAARTLERARQPRLRRAGPEPPDRRAPARPSTGSSGTSSCTSRSTAPCTTRRSRPGASRATTTPSARSR